MRLNVREIDEAIYIIHGIATILLIEKAFQITLAHIQMKRQFAAIFLEKSLEINGRKSHYIKKQQF